MSGMRRLQQMEPFMLSQQPDDGTCLPSVSQAASIARQHGAHARTRLGLSADADCQHPFTMIFTADSHEQAALC